MLIFWILFHLTVFENFRFLFIELIFMHVVGKRQKHSGGESLPLLHYCRDTVSHKNQNLKKSETATFLQLTEDTYTFYIEKYLKYEVNITDMAKNT